MAEKLTSRSEKLAIQDVQLVIITYKDHLCFE